MKCSLTDDRITTVSNFDKMLPDSSDDFYGLTGIAHDKDGCVYVSNDYGICVLNPDLTKLFECKSKDFISELCTQHLTERSTYHVTAQLTPLTKQLSH